MIVHHPESVSEAVSLRHELIDSAYLAGGTEILRLGARPVSDIIDISKLISDEIIEKNGRIYIGARATLEALRASDIVPQFLREAASFCFSFEKRNSATVGGNLYLKRQDSYLAAAFAAAEAEVILECTKGEKNKPIDVYLSKKCRGLVKYYVIDKAREGKVKRFGRTASSHATLIAAESNGVYAISASGSDLAIGRNPDIYKSIEFVSDLEGSAEYKRYLASIVFKEA